jgi:acetyl esterase
MPLDPDIARFLEQNAPALAFPAGARADRQRGRRFLDDIRPRLNTPAAISAETVFSVHDETLEAGRAVRVYRSSRDERRPLIVYLHGGGWVSGGLEMNDGWARRLANATDSVVVSVDYRLAPEHPYPAALEDTMAALAWAHENADRLGGDVRQIAICGTSAGGNLAAGACLLARDRGDALPRLQILLYPVLDVPRDGGSYLHNASGYLLEREQMEWYWDCYLPGRAVHVPAYAAPARSAELAGLPPALVASAEFDPLRDEADGYAERLAEAGVPVEHLACTGMIHGFLSFLDLIPAARDAATRITSAVRVMTAEYCGTA